MKAADQKAWQELKEELVSACEMALKWIEENPAIYDGDWTSGTYYCVIALRNAIAKAKGEGE